MTDTTMEGQAESYFRRVIYPALVLLFILVVASLVFDHSWRIGIDWLHHLLATISGILLILSVVLGPLYVYPTARVRGATPKEAVLASFITPVAWYIKELYRMTGYLPFWEAMYAGLFQSYLMLFLGELGFMGMAEMGYRIYMNKKHGQKVKVLTTKPMIAIIAALAGVFVLFLWKGGVPWYMLYIEGYRALFM